MSPSPHWRLTGAQALTPCESAQGSPEGGHVMSGHPSLESRTPTLSCHQPQLPHLHRGPTRMRAAPARGHPAKAFCSRTSRLFDVGPEASETRLQLILSQGKLDACPGSCSCTYHLRLALCGPSGSPRVGSVWVSGLVLGAFQAFPSHPVTSVFIPEVPKTSQIPSTAFLNTEQHLLYLYRMAPPTSQPTPHTCPLHLRNIADGDGRVGGLRVGGSQLGS